MCYYNEIQKNQTHWNGWICVWKVAISRISLFFEHYLRFISDCLLKNIRTSMVLITNFIRESCITVVNELYWWNSEGSSQPDRLDMHMKKLQVSEFYRFHRSGNHFFSIIFNHFFFTSNTFRRRNGTEPRLRRGGVEWIRRKVFEVKKKWLKMLEKKWFPESMRASV